MRLLLNGGGSDEQLIPTMTKLNEIIDHNKPILYVPLAMNEIEYPYDGCYEWITGELKDVEIPNIEMIRSADELSAKNLDDYSVIFFGGGNTFKLLNDLKECGAFEKIKEYLNNGGVVFGGSAGAIIFGKDLEACRLDDVNEVNLSDTSGFAPSVGQILAKLKVITEPEGISELEAWAMVSKALRNGLYGSESEFDKLPKNVQILTSSYLT